MVVYIVKGLQAISFKLQALKCFLQLGVKGLWREAMA